MYDILRHFMTGISKILLKGQGGGVGGGGGGGPVGNCVNQEHLLLE